MWIGRCGKILYDSSLVTPCSIRTTTASYSPRYALFIAFYCYKGRVNYKIHESQPGSNEDRAVHREGDDATLLAVALPR